jgi:2-oxoglutarate ferredoxin oxidoreductase subunit delta
MKKKFNVEIIGTLCKRCGICVEFCHRRVISLNDNGEVKVVDIDACTGCMLCELRCPDFAVDVTELKT